MTAADATAPPTAAVAAGRWELFRALGAGRPPGRRQDGGRRPRLGRAG